LPEIIEKRHKEVIKINKSCPKSPLSGQRFIDFAQGLNPVKVRVTNVAVEHEVRLMDFTKWLERTGGSPREMTERKRIRSMLGVEKTTSL
jgi:hypothetical protein